jgi:hypothetical protein
MTEKDTVVFWTNDETSFDLESKKELNDDSSTNSQISNSMGSPKNPKTTQINHQPIRHEYTS